MKFTDLGLEEILLKNIEVQGFATCTEIQEKAIPIALEGRDISGLSKTGSGKTAAFLIPLVQRILLTKSGTTKENQKNFESWHKRHCILILVPTRELAEQVHTEVEKLVKDSGLKSMAIYGGVEYKQQTEQVNNGVDFVVATPGRLIDLYKSHSFDLKQVQAVVFDEADRMFDMGFKDDMKFLLRRMPQDRQMMVFSATMNFDVLTVAYQFGADPVELQIGKDEIKAENVKDEIFHVGEGEKPKYLLSLMKKSDAKQIVIFSNYRQKVERIARFLTSNGFPAMGISSLLNQNQRNRVLEQFRQVNQKNILVATDVAARGLDVESVDLVINFDLPDDCENYVHRIGRTGRAGRTGFAFSLVSENDVEALARIESYLKNKISVGWLEDSEMVSEMEEFPVERKRFSKHRDNKRGNSQRSSQSRDQRNNKPKRRNNNRKRHGESSNSTRPDVEGAPARSDNAKRSHSKKRRPNSQKRRDFKSNTSAKSNNSKTSAPKTEGKFKKIIKSIFGLGKSN